MSSRKRKERAEPPHHSARAHASAPSTSGDSSSHQALFIQAYEADVIRGPRAKLAAVSLEISDPNDVFSAHLRASSRRAGDGLIRWTGIHSGAASPAFASDTDQPEPTSRDDAIWVDRYDARFLLDNPLCLRAPEASRDVPDSPGGWSDLPSDAEDTFFFSPEEAEDYHRDKRRRHLEQLREERLQARQAEEGETLEEEVWGESDEEPDEQQKELMRRTASHISSSPNPAQLEMRILANHGSDKRFAFLRGRWRKTWHDLKGKTQMEQQGRSETIVGLGTLADYSDSAGESGDEERCEEAPTSFHAPVAPGGQAVRPSDTEGMVKEARRARAKEWTEQRRRIVAHNLKHVN